MFGIETEKRITESQFDELTEIYSFCSKAFQEKLEQYTGIIAKPYTAYSFYDEAEDYIGDSECMGLAEVLLQAGIEVIADGS